MTRPSPFVIAGVILTIAGLAGQAGCLWGNLIGSIAFWVILSPGAGLVGWILLIEWRDPFTPRRSLPMPITTDHAGAMSLTDGQAGGEVSVARSGDLSTVEP